jgi:hypothetical protein
MLLCSWTKDGGRAEQAQVILLSLAICAQARLKFYPQDGYRHRNASSRGEPARRVSVWAFALVPLSWNGGVGLRANTRNFYSRLLIRSSARGERA